MPDISPADEFSQQERDLMAAHPELYSAYGLERPLQGGVDAVWQNSDGTWSSSAKPRQLGLGDDVFAQGSRVNGTAHSGSDIDVAVRVTPERFNEIINDPSMVHRGIHCSSTRKCKLTDPRRSA